MTDAKIYEELSLCKKKTAYGFRRNVKMQRAETLQVNVCFLARNKKVIENNDMECH